MVSLLDFFKSDEFMPHGHCFLWQKNILLLHVISDAGIAIAYYLIPVLLFYLIRHRKDLPYKPLFTAFSTFILLCGTTHLLSIWVLWYPDYALEGIVKALTAIVSLATLFILWKIVPQALQLIAPADIKESTEQFQLLVNTLPQLAWMADAKGWIFWYNDQWYHYTGTEKKDMEGWGWQSVHDPETLPLVLEKWQASIATGEPFDMVFPLKGKNGLFRPFLTRVVPVRDKQGRITQWFGTNTDITTQKVAEDQAVEALRFSQEGLELGWQGAGNGMWDWDVATSRVTYSDRMLELMGFAPGEVEHHIEEWSNRLHPDDKAHTLTMLSDHIKDGKAPYKAEYRLLTKSGEWRWFLAQGQAKWEKGEAVRMAGSLIDIHDIKKAAEERERLISLIEESVDFIGMADMEGNLLYHNRSAKRMIGLPEDYDLSRLKMSDMHPAWASKLIQEEAIPAVFKKGSWLGETALLHKDGREISVLQNLALHRNAENEPVYFTTIMRDFTEHKALERMKDEFVSTVSHELRTPLTSIRGSLGLIIGGVAGDNMPSKALHLVDIAYKNCDRLILIINDILDIESIEAGLMQFNLKWEDLETLLSQAVDLNKPYADKLNVKLFLQPLIEPVKINVDSSRFSQVISNLLSNAAKFSPDGGTVHIRAEAETIGVSISIADQGAGIPEEFQPRIFNKFAQADSSDSKTKGGTGLGLSITRSMVERMGGKIRFITAAHVGTTFVIDFPTSKPDFHESNQRGRILICEDDESIAHLLKATLEDRGFLADITTSTLQANHMLMKNTYIAMTLDLILPDKNGLDFYRELRAQEKTLNLPIIVISAKANEEKTALNGSAMGIIDWLVKPIDFDRLLSAVYRISRKKGHPTILHVEDDRDIAQIIALKLQASANVIHARTLEEAKSLLLTQEIHLLLIDIGLPDGSGLGLLEFNIEHQIAVPIVILSASEVSAAVTQKVSSVFIKAKTSEEHITETIFALIDAQKSSK